MHKVRTTIAVTIMTAAAVVLCGCGGGGSASIPSAPAKPDMHALGALLPTYTSQNVLDGQLWALIAGAGQNDPTKGILIGNVSVSNDSENLYVQYIIDEAGWAIDETHVYAGTQPPATRAPGQFPYKHDALSGVTTDEYIIPLLELGVGANDTLYIATHATVCTEGEASFVEGVLTTVTLWADQIIDAGTVTVAIVGDNLVVTYETAGGAQMTQTCLYVDTVPPDEPPDPTNFPYRHEVLGGVTTNEYSIPLSDLGVECGEPLYLAAYAALQNVLDYDGDGNLVYMAKTAWAEGDLIGECWWAMYFQVPITCDGGEVQCETAWAYGDYELPGQAWGWYFEYAVQ